jgi:hypothetical protein
MPRTVPPPPHKMNDYFLLVVGIALIIFPVWFDVWKPDRFVEVQTFLRVIASLGGGLVGASIPGIIHVNFSWLRASGAIALVALFYLANPPGTFNAQHALQSAKIDEDLGTNFDVAENTDRPGFNIPTAVNTTDPRVCETACLSNDTCKAYVIRKAGQPAEGCYLKSQVDPNVVSNTCCTTGIRHKPAHYELRSSLVDDFLDCAVDGTPIPRIGFHHSGVQVVNLDGVVHPQSKGKRTLKCKLTDTGGTDGHPCWGWEFEIWRNNVLQSRSENFQCSGNSPQTPTLHVPFDIDPVDIKVE